MNKSLLLSFFFIGLSCFSEDLKKDGQKNPPVSDMSQTKGVWNDIYTTGKLLFKGSYLQFTQKQNLYYAAASIAPLWYSFEEDKRLSNMAQKEKLNKIVDIVGEASVIVNFPIAHMGMYLLGKKTQNNHLLQFTYETMATTYLALAESMLISYIHIHKRPSEDNLTSLETNFRGDSSFPSGHIIGFSALFFKTLQFYGPWWSLLPLGLTALTSAQRVQDGKHFVSDVVGGFFLTAFASEGVRAAGQYKKNHPFYRWVFEHNVQLGLIRHKTAFGPRLVFSF